MRPLRFLLPLVATACAASAPPEAASPGPNPIPVPAPQGVKAPVTTPAGLAVWVHVDDPGRLLAVADRMGAADKGSAGVCANGDFRACAPKLADLHAPVDAAASMAETSDDANAVAFGVKSVEDFQAAAAKEFQVTTPAPGRVVLAMKTASVGAAPGKPMAPVVCDTTAAGSHRVVCGNEVGVKRLGPWLLTSPRPATGGGELLRVEIFKEPVVAAADKQFTHDTLVQKETRQLAHDFGGAVLTLSGSDAPGGVVQFGIDVHMQGAQSRWTKMLLAPTAGAAPVPDTFARLSAGASAAVYLPGGGPFVALLDQLDAFSSLLPLEQTKTKPVIDEARGVLGRPMVCGYVIDLDAGRAALGKARHAAEKDKKKAKEALEAALNGHAVCGLQEPAKAAADLTRKLSDLAPASPGDSTVVRPAAAAMGLPKGSFVVETTHKKPKAPSSVDTAIGVADGDTTWFVFANDAADVPRATHAATRLLSNPKGAGAAFPLASGTVLSGYVTTLIGAFFMDLATDSLDGVEKTLATPSFGRLQISLSEHTEGPGGVVSLGLSTDVATVPAFALRASALALPLAMIVGLAMAGDDSK